MKVGDLSHDRLEGLLRTRGIILRSGSFVFRLTSHLPEVAQALRLLYAEFPIEDDGLVDFHLLLRPSRGLARLRGRAEILIDSHRVFAPFPRATALPHLEWALNWWIYSYAHQFLIVHAAVAADPAGQAVLLSGPPGSGKSTLCAALICRGWRLLSDELAIMPPGEARLLALARPVSLKNESIPVLAAFAPEAVFGPEAHGTQKGVVAHLRPPNDSVARVGEIAEPRWIVFPRYVKDASTELTPEPKARAFMQLADNSFNYRIMGPEAFEQLSGLLDRCHCYALVYSDLDDAIGVLNGLD